MNMKLWYFLPLLMIVSLYSCQQGQRAQDSFSPDTIKVEPMVEDTLSNVEEEIEEADASERLDGSFDDFLFAFTHSRRLQYQRITWPLQYVTSNGEEKSVGKFDCASEFAFLEGDFYTVLYGASNQIESIKESQNQEVQIERIDLQGENVRVYNFKKQEGKWMFVGFCDTDFSSIGLKDFLSFYSKFSSDSIFQQHSIAQPLKIVMLDPEDDESYVEGTIDAAQWSSFCPEVPCGMISNIRFGQEYGLHQMILQKCGSANGMQELFTFQREGLNWHLVSYEN